MTEFYMIMAILSTDFLIFVSMCPRYARSRKRQVGVGRKVCFIRIHPSCA
jgi:hypothetical protein